MSTDKNGVLWPLSHHFSRLFKLEESEGEWENKEICLGTKDICTGDLWNYFPENILSFGEDEAGTVMH